MEDKCKHFHDNIKLDTKSLYKFLTTKQADDKGAVDYAVLICLKFMIVLVPISLIYLIIDLIIK